MTLLRPATLADLDPAVQVPRYDRSRVEVGHVHLGVGGFHRAHQAVYTDDLLGDGDHDGWGLCGVGVLPGDASLLGRLAAQDGLYTVVHKHGDGRWEPRVVGPHRELLHAPADPEAVLSRLAAPTTRVVSLTITEGGYVVDHDPAGAFGYLVTALQRRRTAGVVPFTVLSCDNVPGNGGVARAAVVEHATAVDPALGAWVAEHVAFPDSMVDRITPVTTDADRAAVRERFGVHDECPVVCEPFRQWVVQDRFPAGRPAWERLGVLLVQDVEPYELMKLRLLNAGHQVVGFAGSLLGHTYVHEAMTDPTVVGFLKQWWDCEAVPSIPPVAGIDVPGYLRTLVERFSNPEVADTLQRLCTDVCARIPTWVVPVVRERLARHQDVRRAAALVACWARYAQGTDDTGRRLVLQDVRAAERAEAAAAERHEPLAFLRARDLFGDLADDPRFTGPYAWALDELSTRGTRAMLAGLAGLDPVTW